MRIWVGRWLEVLFEEEKWLEGWFLQINYGEMMGIQDLEKEFWYYLKGFYKRETCLIPGGVDVGERMRLRRSLSRGSTVEVLNRGLYTEVIEANYRWSKRYQGRGGV